jgi:signal peptidase I
LLRKSLAQIHEVQIPVFSMSHVPSNGGWAERWEVGPLAEAAKMPALKPKLPIVTDVVHEDRLVINALETPFGLTYRHRDLDSKRDSSVRDRLPYNGGPSHRVWLPVHDFIVTFEVEVLAGMGSLGLRLDDGVDRVVVDLPIGGGTGRIGPEDGMAKEFNLPAPFTSGHRYRIEFAFVDRRVFLTVDGRELMEPVDLPAVPARLITDPAGKRQGTERPFQLGARGVSVVLHQLTLSRDIHYRSEDEDAINATRRPLQLGTNQYFLMGDNSASSSDSRVWEVPTVDRTAFLGKPFFVHQPLKQGHVPLFGAVQTLDWHRLRFLE